jgi:hypothetical protein
MKKKKKSDWKPLVEPFKPKGVSRLRKVKPLYGQLSFSGTPEPCRKCGVYPCKCEKDER